MAVAVVIAIAVVDVVRSGAIWSGVIAHNRVLPEHFVACRIVNSIVLLAGGSVASVITKNTRLATI